MQPAGFLLQHLGSFIVLRGLFVGANRLLSSCGMGPGVVTHRFSWPMSCGILALQPRVEPTFSALENRLLITGPQGSPLNTRALTPCMGLSWWLSGKELACQCRRHQFDPWVRKIPWRRNILAWRIPWTEKPGGEQSRGSQKSQTGLSN